MIRIEDLPYGWTQCVPQKQQQTCTRLHGVIIPNHCRRENLRSSIYCHSVSNGSEADGIIQELERTHQVNTAVQPPSTGPRILRVDRLRLFITSSTRYATTSIHNRTSKTTPLRLRDEAKRHHGAKRTTALHFNYSFFFGLLHSLLH